MINNEAEVIKELNKYRISRPVTSVRKIKSTGDFTAIEEAERILSGEGYNTAPLCMDKPVGFSREYRVAKWAGLSHGDYAKLDGVILSKDFRTDDVFIIIFK